MITVSRTDIYDYVYGLLFGVVTKNVYRMGEAQELLDSDTNDGFVTISVGDIIDESEFRSQTFGWCRVTLTAYVPPKSRGRLDRDKYKVFEDGIDSVINNEMDNGSHEVFSIQEDGILSMDGVDDSNANNLYYLYIKSFIVTID